jgi:hypothetical protein
MPGNITIRRAGRPVQLSIVNILGLVGIVSILTAVVITHPIGRIAGPVWILFGLGLYYVFRRRQRLPFPDSVTRDWPKAQLETLRLSGEDALADEYEQNLHRARLKAAARIPGP